MYLIPAVWEACHSPKMICTVVFSPLVAIINEQVNKVNAMCISRFTAEVWKSDRSSSSVSVSEPLRRGQPSF